MIGRKTLFCALLPIVAVVAVQAPAEARNTVREGDEGEDVVALQEFLNDRGYDVGTPDGKFGPGTARAVRRFQEANGMEADAIVGAGTWRALESGTARPAPSAPAPSAPAPSAPDTSTTAGRLAAALEASSRAANPTLEFLRRLGTMGNLDLRSSDIRDAMAQAGISSSDALGQVLAPITRLRRSGDRVSIQRSRNTTLNLGTGSLRLGRDVGLDLSVNRSRAEITNISGLEAAEQGGSFYDLKKVKFQTQGGRPVAEVTAGWGIFTKTVTIDLSPTDRRAELSTPAEGPGIVGRIGQG
jgi:peptidoglycan hydrolase-like protein with peptidoglycan-binding domain